MNQKVVFSIITFLIVFVVYLKTLAPTVTFIDSGELAAVASTLGIAHPTGYPLFTILGYLFTKLPISSSEVYKLNFMSGLLCAFAVFIFYFLMNYMYSSENKDSAKIKDTLKQKQPEKEKGIPDIVKTGLCMFSSLELAFSRTFWSQANSVEVYSLHTFFLVTLIFIFLKAVSNKSSPDGNFIGNNKLYLLFSFMLGLSFTNHLTTILLAPACLTLFFVKKKSEGEGVLKLLVYMSICFIAGFSVYLYLPIKASMEPMFLWGNPYNLERFIWHITGKQFSVWIFSAKGSIATFLILLAALESFSIIGLLKYKSLNRHYHLIVFLILSVLTYAAMKSSNEIVVRQFNFFLDSLWKEFGPWMILFALIGVYRLSQFNLSFYYFTILSFFGCTFYSVNYDIHDISSYFLLAYIVLAVWMGFGALLVYEKVSIYLKNAAAQTAFAAMLVLLSVITIKANYEENDESKEYYVEQYMTNIFKNAEQNSIIISSQWDFWVSASWYFQAVKNMRPDLVVIDKELLRRSWYYIYLKRHYPEIYENSKAEIERFLVELNKFEHDIPYDQRTIMKAYTDMLTSFAEKNPGRKIYTTWEIEQNKEEAFAPNYERISDGILLQLVKKDASSGKKPEIKVYDFSFTPTSKKDYYHETIMNTYTMMLTNSAYYLFSLNRIEDTKKYLDLALTAKPNAPQALELKKKLGY